MLSAITSKIERLGGKLRGRIYFSSASEFGKAETNLKKRRFFGLSGKARAWIIRPRSPSWSQGKSSFNPLPPEKVEETAIEFL